MGEGRFSGRKESELDVAAAHPHCGRCQDSLTLAPPLGGSILSGKLRTDHFQKQKVRGWLDVLTLSSVHNDKVHFYFQ